MTNRRVFKFMAIAALLLSVGAGGAEQKHRYIFVYTTPVQYFSGVQLACIACDSRSYRPEERHEWYDTLAKALEGMNNFQHPSAWTGGSGSIIFSQSQPPPAYASEYAKVIGLYEVTEVPTKLVQTGTEKHSVQKTVEEDVPVMEWQVKHN